MGPNGDLVFLYDEAGHMVGEYDGTTGAVVEETVWLEDLPVAMMTGSGTGASVYNIHPGHLGEPKDIRDQTGNVVWSWDHDPFGNGQPNGTLTYNLRYPGQYYDAETGLSYNMNRDYDARLGRYVESDPIGLNGGINTYGYVGQNPLWATDPDGLIAVLAAPAVAAAVDSGAAAAALAGAAGALAAWWHQQSDSFGGPMSRPDPVERGNNDPVKYDKVNPGRDCTGNCNPCPPDEVWEASGSAHGSTNGLHYHGIQWNQNPENCECYPKRVSGSTPSDLK